MLGFRPSKEGWWMIATTLLLLWMGVYWWWFAMLGLIAAGTMGVSLVRHVKAAPRPELPDPIAEMVTFKAKRRAEEVEEWDRAFEDALPPVRIEVRCGMTIKLQTPVGYYSLDIAAADPVNPRIDAVLFRGYRQVEVVTGTPAAWPVRPNFSGPCQIAGYVLVPAGATQLGDSDLLPPIL